MSWTYYPIEREQNKNKSCVPRQAKEKKHTKTKEGKWIG